MDHTFVKFQFGESVKLVGIWTSNFETPAFTLEAYVSNSTTVIAALRAEDIAHIQTFAHIVHIVISVDSSSVVQQFAQKKNLPYFQGVDAFYWALHFSLTQ